MKADDLDLTSVDGEDTAKATTKRRRDLYDAAAELQEERGGAAVGGSVEASYELYTNAKTHHSSCSKSNSKSSM